MKRISSSDINSNICDYDFLSDSENISRPSKIRKLDNTLLHEAVNSGSLIRVSKVLENGNTEILNAKNEDGYTPLHCAVIKGSLEITGLLLRSLANMYEVTTFYETVLHLAAFHKHANIIQLILEEHNNDTYFVNMRDLMGKTAFHYACKNGDESTVKRMVKNNSDIHIQDSFFSSPLHVAAFYNHPKVVEFLLKNGANVNAKDAVGYTALSYAQDFRSFKVSELLSQYKGEANQASLSSKELRLARSNHEEIIRRCYL